MNDDSLRQAWRDQPMNAGNLSLDEVKGEAKRLHRRIALGNVVEYAACAVVLGVFAYYIYAFPSLLMRIGSFLVMVATLFVAWQMRRRASSRALPSAMGDQPWLHYHRSQLVRQRDALRSAWLWYVAPFVPGVVVFRLGVETDLLPGGAFARGWGANLFIALVFVGVAAWNRLAARQLQRRIDKLDEQAR